MVEPFFILLSSFGTNSGGAVACYCSWLVLMMMMMMMIMILILMLAKDTLPATIC